MKVVIGIILLLCLFLVDRVNELHEKVDRAGVALEHATQELDEASQFVYQKLLDKQAADKKIDEELKDVPNQEPTVATPEPPAAATTPKPTPHKKGPFFK